MQDHIAELETRLKQKLAPQAEIDTLNELAWLLRHAQPERAMELCQKAAALARTGEYEVHPYREGRAASLTTQGFLSHQNGSLDTALTQCFEAAAVLEGLPPNQVSIDCRRIISWIYYFIGDHTTALNHGLQALRLAQELDLKDSEASVMDGLAMIYVASGDPQQALMSSNSALSIAESEANRLLQVAILNNRANILLETGDTQAALESAQKSLDLSRQMSLSIQEISTLDTLGTILVARGDLAQAEQVLADGLGRAREAGLALDQVYLLLSLSKLYLKLPDLNKARDHLQQALNLATRSGMQGHQAECHLKLSEVYERLDNPLKALEHHKSFYSLHEKANNETAGKQLAALKVAYQVETAQRDAEIYRLRTVELQHEIDERKRMEVELERLATIDPLTNLYNRRHFFKLAQAIFDRAKRYNRPLTVLMLDLDHFKDINDAYGHAIGDKVLTLLSAYIVNTLRGVDIIGRYGGEEFCIAMTETSATQGLLAAERLRSFIEQQSFETSAGGISVTITIGLASIPEGIPARGDLDHLLSRADQAMYLAKRSGRNRVEIATPDGWL